MNILFKTAGKRKLQLSYYLVLSFWLGFVTFVIEMLGPRMLAPYVGTEFTVWANIIGMTLAGLSLGYLVGGRYADSAMGKRVISLLLLACGLDILFLALAGELITVHIALALKNVSLASLAASTLLFFPFNFLLGCINPIIVKLFAASDSQKIGRQIGLLYMLSSVGSFIGIFATSYLLIPFFDLRSILFFCAFFFMGLALLHTPYKRVILFSGIASLLLYRFAAPGSQSLLARLYGENRMLLERDTVYNRIRVFLSKENGRQKLSLILNNTTAGAQYKDSPALLAMNYLTYFPVMNAFNNSITSVLMIGGGANNYSSRFFTDNPKAHMDVVEIDPEVAAIAKRYFKTPYGADRTSYIYEDGRVFLNKTNNIYDSIILDAFNGYTIPFQLTTLEFFKNASRSLGPNGTIIINTISALEGKRGGFFSSQYKTLSAAFPHVYVFPTQKGQPEEMQNIILVGSKTPIPDDASSPFAKYLTQLYIPSPDKHAILFTDNYAPVEFLGNSGQ